MDLQALIAEGFYDPDAANADDRLALLEFLTERGATIDDFRMLKDPSYLAGSAIDLIRRVGRRFLTAEQVAAEAHVEVATVERVVRAAGLPAIDLDVPMFRAEDVAAMVMFDQGASTFGEDPTLEFTRVVGAAMASIADSAMALFGINIAGHFEEQETTELEQAQIAEFSTAMLTDGVPQVIDFLFFHHVGAAARRSAATRSDDANTATMAVGFLDLVASTALNRRLDPKDLAAAIGGFERDATQLVGSGGGRVVKTIGDEVMFVHADPAAACELALALRDAVVSNPLLGSVRGGLAAGDLVLGYGDFYGRDVNLAARLVKLAEPDQILVTADLAGQAEGAPDLRFVPVDDVVVFGFDDPVSVASLHRSGVDA